MTAPAPRKARKRNGGDGPGRPGGRSRWTQDPEGVRREILDVARGEFVESGLAGARVDAIAARTAVSKRMIYYYFTDKEGLYRAVLEEAYRRIRGLERTLDLDRLPPMEALARLTGFSFDHHADNPDFVRLVMVENIHRARYLAEVPGLAELNRAAVGTLADLYARGVRDGVFREGLDPLDLHLTTSALAFYNASNRFTVREGFGHDMAEPEARARRRRRVIETMCRFVARDPSGITCPME